MDPDVVDELVLGLERSQLPAAVAPQTDVVGLFSAGAGAGAAARRAADVLDADVRHQLIHGRERAPTHDRRQRR